MDKQRTVNTVTANDDFSSGLMEAYNRWMGGDTFQNSTIAEEEIPTGQKQGGGSSGAFTTAIGSVPAVEFDSSTGLPVIDKKNADDGSKKDPKSSSNGGEPPTNAQGLKPKYGAQIRQTTLVPANEEKKAKKDYDGDGKVESGKDEYFGSRDKAIKKAMGKKMKKEDAQYGYDSKGNSLNPKDKGKKMKKEENVWEAAGCCKKCGSKDHTTSECKTAKEEVEAYLWSQAEEILTELSEVTETTWFIEGQPWEELTEEEIRELEEEKAKGLDGKACWKGYKLAGTKKKGGKTVDNCVKAGYEPDGHVIEDTLDSEEWKAAAAKQTSRIMDMWKEGYGKGKSSKKKKMGY